MNKVRWFSEGQCSMSVYDKGAAEDDSDYFNTGKVADGTSMEIEAFFSKEIKSPSDKIYEIVDNDDDAIVFTGTASECWKAVRV